MAWVYHSNDPLPRSALAENPPAVHWPLDGPPEAITTPSGGPYTDFLWAYRLDEASGAIQDSSPNGNHGGAASGATYEASTSDWLGQQSCMSFDGTNDYVDGVDVGWDDAHTLSYWVYITSLAADAHVAKCVSGSVTGVTGKLYSVTHTAGGLLQIEYLKTAASPVTSAATMFAAGYWHFVHLSATATGGDTTIRASVYRLGYADGAGLVAREDFTFAGVTATTVAYPLTGRAWALGCTWNTGARTAYLAGRLMDVRFLDGTDETDSTADERYYWSQAGLQDTVNGIHYLTAASVDATYRAADVVPGLRGIWADGSTVLSAYYSAQFEDLLLDSDFTAAMILRPTRYPAAGTPDDIFTIGVPGAEGSDDDNMLAQVLLEGVTNRLGMAWETTGQVDVSDFVDVAATALVPIHLTVRREGLVVSFFLFGTLVGSFTESSAPVGDGTPADSLARFRLFGGSATGISTASEIALASLVIYPAALTDCQISNLWEPGSCPIPVAGIPYEPATGPIDGGTHYTVISSEMLDMSQYADAFTAATLSAAWTDASSGGALYPSENGLQLRADGLGAVRQTAELRSAATVETVDFEFDLRSRRLEQQRLEPLALAPTLAEVGLHIDADNTAALRWSADGRARLYVRAAGQTLYEHAVETDRPIVARVVRHGSRVLFYANGARVADVRWSSAAAHIRLAVTSGPTAQPRDRARLLVTAFRRRPVFLFGDILAPDYLLSRSYRQDILSPPYPLPRTVDITVYGPDDVAPATLDDAFTYTLGDRTALRTGRGALYVLEEPESNG